MALTLDATNFTARQIANYPRAMQDLIRFAILLGWTLHLAKGSTVLRSYDGAKMIRLSKKHTSGPMVSNRRIVFKHADPLRIAAFIGEIESGVVPSGELVPVSLSPELLRELADDAGIELPSAESAESVEPETVQEDPVSPVAETPVEEVVKMPSTKLSDEVAEGPKPYLVSEKPYLAHARLTAGKTYGLSYPSEVIVEQVWSDGTRLLKCRLCPFSRPKEDPGAPRAITSHWRKHVGSGEVEKVQNNHPLRHDLVEDPTYTELAYARSGSSEPRNTYKPKDERVEELVDRMLAEIEGKRFRREDLVRLLAETALVWVHERNQSNGTREPLTDAEVIARIRTLVDRGAYADIRGKMAEMEDRVVEAEARAATAEERAHKAVSTLQAFRELAAAELEESDS